MTGFDLITCHRVKWVYIARKLSQITHLMVKAFENLQFVTSSEVVCMSIVWPVYIQTVLKVFKTGTTPDNGHPALVANLKSAH